MFVLSATIQRDRKTVTWPRIVKIVYRVFIFCDYKVRFFTSASDNRVSVLSFETDFFTNSQLSAFRMCGLRIHQIYLKLARVS